MALIASPNSFSLLEICKTREMIVVCCHRVLQYISLFKDNLGTDAISTKHK